MASIPRQMIHHDVMENFRERFHQRRDNNDTFMIINLYYLNGI